jgi:hypothetical protein
MPNEAKKKESLGKAGLKKVNWRKGCNVYFGIKNILLPTCPVTNENQTGNNLEQRHTGR